ncbi:ribosome-associated translation inhibitor RaiA [Ectobacillus antri]|jgi:putative sigma-54 modulation protein|uniref:Ribosome hibernation promoting factor n=1 Tax=Ectobacillus antri TaxID=2486280 RepID=A0ABT6H771_9BACI|nr:ribosome-associated translation inhibitor RaiA [Ectobacillus antri]MDG4657176.1 ribosome-associated translation inhibitor RaiA [Ectobacillus antri]MDG5755189.1 ribosome-associated translation inhibitor RaiA [Ectobacillus antri]
MKFNVRGENIEVTPALREYVEKKLSKLDRYFDTFPEIKVNLKVYSDKQRVEVTIPFSNLMLRAEETHDDMYAAIDLVVDKLERQIRKHKTKVNRKLRTKVPQLTVDSAIAVQETVDEDEMELVRTKRFDLKPMDAEEAILQMNMLGHNFFVFTNAHTNETNVVYTRRDGKYGLIETK